MFNSDNFIKQIPVLNEMPPIITKPVLGAFGGFVGGCVAGMIFGKPSLVWGSVQAASSATLQFAKEGLTIYARQSDMSVRTFTIINAAIEISTNIVALVALVTLGIVVPGEDKFLTFAYAAGLAVTVAANLYLVVSNLENELTLNEQEREARIKEQEEEQKQEQERENLERFMNVGGIHRLNY